MLGSRPIPGTIREGGQTGCCFHYASALLWAPTDGPVMGWWLLGWAGEQPGQGIICDPPPAVVSLCSFVGVRVGFIA